MKRRNNAIFGKPLVPPRAIELRYARELSRLIKSMAKDFYSVIKIYKDKKYQVAVDDEYGQWLTTDMQERISKLGKIWEKRFKEYAERATPQMMKNILKMSDIQLKSALKDFYSAQKLALIGLTIPNDLKQVINAHIAENVSLIRSIPAQYLERIQGAITRAITGGASVAQLVRQVHKYQQMSLRRAKLVASDQVNKAFTTINIHKFGHAGVKKVQWLHTGIAKEPRPYHIRKWDGVSGLKDGHPNGLNGFIFDVNKPPIIDEKTGIRGYPAQIPYCRCIMIPVMEE